MNIVKPISVFLTINVFLSADKAMSKIEAIGGGGGAGAGVAGAAVVGGFGSAPVKTVTSEPFVSMVSNIADINSA